MIAKRHATKPCTNYLGLILKDLGFPCYACGSNDVSGQVSSADTGYPCSTCVGLDNYPKGAAIHYGNETRLNPCLNAFSLALC